MRNLKFKIMKRYLATLHTKSDHHKKRFAFLASGSVTLLIFGIWSLATFGIGDEVAENLNNTENRVATEQEVSPLESLLSGVAASFQALRGNVTELKQGLEVVNPDYDQ